VSTDEATRYRRALGAYATGVAVVTVAQDAENPDLGAYGVTINSFTSVSLSPRLILWCLDDASERGRLFAKAQTFGINVLAEGDRHVSDRFARGDGYKLDADEVVSGPHKGDAPLLKAAVTRLSCKLHAQYQMGDHLVIVGEVTDFDTAEGESLLYYRGKYSRAHVV
jgi:flavin reductase (DIM6/NTAB) family NADH-FMN oxidoreductase RutF